MIVVPDAAEVALLDGTWSGLADDLVLHLFTNDVTTGLSPEEIDELTAVDFTEATFTGYAAVTLLAAGWTVTAGNPTTGVHATQSFTSSANQTAQTVRGYYVVDSLTGGLRWFEPFPTGPVVVEFLDDEIQITPTLTLDDREGNAVSIGTIEMWPTDTAPANYLLCDGSAVSRSTFSLLFAVIGETYGAGDGSTTFEVPDFRGVFPLGVATSGTGATLGETGGAIDHTHGLDTPTSAALVHLPTGKIIKQNRSGLTSWTATREAAVSAGSSTDSDTVGTSLVGASDTENPPFLAVNFIIKAT